MVVLVVVMVSPHSMGPSGCQEEEDRKVAKGGERQVA